MRINRSYIKPALFFLFTHIYFWTAHYFFLGFTTWDGFNYRTVPVVELAQNGIFIGDKFSYIATRYATPFLELANYPFIKLLGLPGLYFGYNFILLPLSTLSIYHFVKVLTNNHQWAILSALVYLSIPFVNEQPFSGYIDFAVIGALAFFLYTLVRFIRSVKKVKQSRIDLLLISLSTFIYTMSRQQTPYVAVLFVSFIFSYTLFIKQFKWFFKILFPFIIGLSPALTLQLLRWHNFGSPWFPIGISIFGVDIFKGADLSMIRVGAGLTRGYLGAFVNSWIYPETKPASFFDSRSFGAGFLLYFALFTSLVSLKKLDRLGAISTILLILVSLIIWDLWLPRYAYSLTLALILLLGGALACLLNSAVKWQKTVGFILLTIIFIQLLGRPLYSMVVREEPKSYSISINLSKSKYYIKPSTDIILYPDNDDYFILVSVDQSFYLPLYGKQLTNRIIGTYTPDRYDKSSCIGLLQYQKAVREKYELEKYPTIIDHQGLLRQPCHFKCVTRSKGGCLVYQQRDLLDMEDSNIDTIGVTRVIEIHPMGR